MSYCSRRLPPMTEMQEKIHVARCTLDLYLDIHQNYDKVMNALFGLLDSSASIDVYTECRAANSLRAIAARIDPSHEFQGAIDEVLLKINSLQNEEFGKIRQSSRGSTSPPASSESSISEDASPVAAANSSPSANKKRTLSESSSSDEAPAKKPREATPPPMTILNELLPESPQKTGPSAMIGETSPQLTEEMEAQQEQENVAPRSREEVRRCCALDDQPVLQQQEVMQAFESEYGDFTY